MMSVKAQKTKIKKSTHSPRKWIQPFSTGSKSFLLIDRLLIFSENFIFAGDTLKSYNTNAICPPISVVSSKSVLGNLANLKIICYELDL